MQQQSIADLEAQFHAARSANHPSVVLEGFHAIKHAMRFGVVPSLVVSPDPVAIDALATELAPDIRDKLHHLVTEISRHDLVRLAPHAPSSPIIAIGPRHRADLAAMLLANDQQHIVMLEDPRHTGNVGAVIRVAAAAGAAGVATIGDLDPWSSPVLRGAAGLHYAIKVASIANVQEVRALPVHHRPLVALDPQGIDLQRGAIPRDAVLVFGTERHGLSEELRDAADMAVRLPMRAGVSSLNLATAVSATLFMLQAPR